MPEPDVEDALNDLAREFEFLLAREGLTTSPEQRAALLSTYADMKNQMALLDRTLTSDVEPSTVFHLGRVTQQ